MKGLWYVVTYTQESRISEESNACGHRPNLYPWRRHRPNLDGLVSSILESTEWGKLLIIYQRCRTHPLAMITTRMQLAMWKFLLPSYCAMVAAKRPLRCNPSSRRIRGRNNAVRRQTMKGYSAHLRLLTLAVGQSELRFWRWKSCDGTSTTAGSAGSQDRWVRPLYPLHDIPSHLLCTVLSPRQI